MKYLLVTGSYPPDICGVGDYSSKVITSDYAKSNNWELYYKRNGWKISSFFARLKDLVKSDSDTIIFEMPTLGYGKSLSVHFVVALLALFSRKKIVVRLHEYTQLSKKARFAVSIMLMTANCVIFTNDYDREQASKAFKRLKSRSGVVKIYSNIANSEIINDFNHRQIDVVYFGHIRPLKGLDIFMDCIKNIKSRANINAVIIGQVPKGYEDYYESIAQRAAEIGIELRVNAPEKDVIETLNNSKIAFLPFPDGLSERRGSFLAALKNGCVVISTPGLFSKGKINEAAVLSDSPQVHEDMILKLLNNEDLWTEQHKRGFTFLSQEMPSSWSDVAEKYSQLIDRL